MIEIKITCGNKILAYGLVSLLESWDYIKAFLDTKYKVFVHIK